MGRQCERDRCFPGEYPRERRSALPGLIRLREVRGRSDLAILLRATPAVLRGDGAY